MIKWKDMSGEKNTEKNSGFQMGTEPTTFRTLVGFDLPLN